MSSYEAVVPVSWSRLTEIVLPAWTDVLAHRRSMESFGREFAPDHWETYARYNGPIPTWDAPTTYLEDVQWRSGMPFLPADHLRRSAQHAAIQPSWLTEDATQLLCRAIIGTASELAGPDTVDAPYNGFYNRLHEPPHPQVAGTKNQYHFLSAFFQITWERESSGYRHVARPSVDSELVALLEALFLSTRSFPGMWCLCAENGMWPGYDDASFQGILTPREVGRLAVHLAAMDPRAIAAHDELYLLFVDRVRRAAEQGLGLVTLHAML